MQGMGRGSQNRAPQPQQQQPQPKPKLVQKSLAPYNPRMAQSASGRGMSTAGWNNNGGGGAAAAPGTAGALAAAAPSAPPAAEPAAAVANPSRGAADAKPSESKATDFSAFLKKGAAPQGMRLPDDLSNAAKKDAGSVVSVGSILPSGFGAPGAQTVPYVRPADRGAEQNPVSDDQPATVDPNAAAMELIQRNKNQTAKAAAQIPFQQDVRAQAIRPPPQQLNQQQRGDSNRLPSRNGGTGSRNGALDRNRDRDRGTKKLGDRLALARGIEMPASRPTANGNGSGAPAPSSAADDTTSNASSAQQEQQRQSALLSQHPLSTRDGESGFEPNMLALDNAPQDQNADLDFERLMKEMVRHCRQISPLRTVGTCLTSERAALALLVALLRHAS